MRIAVTAWNFSPEGIGHEIADQAVVAESMGFDSFWLPENHFTGPAAIPSPLMLLAAVASRTERIRLGSTSYLLPIRNPILAAEEVAVLDRLSNGRVILGLGRGFQDAMFATFDIPTSEKRKRFKENLTRMISAWAGEPISEFENEPVYLAPLPVQQPHPPLWVAAFGPLAIKQAGSLGLPYIASPVESIDSLEANISAHRSHAAEAGHPVLDTTPVMRTVFITERASLSTQVKDSLTRESAGRFRAEESAIDDWAIVGDPDFVKDKLVEYQERLGLNYLIARGRIAGVDDSDQIRSHERLMQFATT